MIDRAHLELWADMQSAQGDFPELIHRLVSASVTPYLEKCNIPFGSAVNLGGWDGEVDATQQTEYIPQGKSLLEFGTNKKVQPKAEADYSKRISDSSINKAEITFIFMTPHVWEKKDEWVESKKKDGIWKDVRVYDSTVIAQWIISVPSVELWFAPHVGIQPDHLIMGEERLEELLTGMDVKLRPTFYTAGREKIAQELLERLNQPTLMAYRAASKEEAMGFILAAGKLFPEKQQKEYYAKTIVVEDKSKFRLMGTQTSMINLVPAFEDATVLYRAVSQGKIVLVPLGPGDDFNQLVVELPSADRFGLEQSLIESGIQEDKARRVIKDCSCNLTMIKKALGFPILRVDWLNDENIEEIAPALIVERWNDNYDGDKEVMSSLSGMSYNDFMASIIRWSQKPVPPVMNVGALWRITSPLSLWSDLALIVKKEQLDCLSLIAHKVLTGEEKLYSDQLRQGILNTLIILSWHGNQLIVPESSCQSYTDSIIQNLIANADATRWGAIAKQLPLIAEASPSIFTNEINTSLAQKDAPIMSLFNEEDGLFAPESKYPYLLWALESLAWLPDRILEVADILLKLSERDPGGKLANRPFSSLVDIFLPWKPHTTASFEDRLSILHELGKRGYSKMWDLLVALLPKNSGYTSGTHQLKWRGYDLSVPSGVTYAEIWKHAEFVCDELKACYDGSDSHMAELIDDLLPIPSGIRSKLISWIKDTILLANSQLPETRKKMRETLWFQKNRKEGSPGYLNESELEDIRSAYNALTPDNPVERDKWLFDELAPRLPEIVEDEGDYLAEMKVRIKQRDNAVAGWLQCMSIEDVVLVRKMVKEPHEFGQTLGHFYETEGLTELVFNLLLEPEDDKFVCGYLQGMESARGEEETIEYLEGLKYRLTDKELAAVLHYLFPSPQLFAFVETTKEPIQKEYWIKYSYGSFGHYDDTSAYVLNKMVSVGRSLDALTGSWHMVKDMPTELLQNLLMGSIQCSMEINGPIDILAFESYLEELHQREDADKDKLIALEWFLVPLLRHSSSKDIVRLLFEKLQKEPEFFVELLTYLFRPENEKEEEPDGKADSKPADENNAIRAFYLFREWRLIPGVDKNGVIDGNELRNWIEKALQLAKDVDREKFVYVQLGEVFAKYPENKENPNWPPKELFAIMEELNSEVLFRNYSTGMFNKRGFTTRGGYDGGDIERDDAAYFEDLKSQCLPLYPHVAKVFGGLADQYQQMAKEMDDQATIAKLDY